MKYMYAFNIYTVTVAILAQEIRSHESDYQCV